MLSFFGLYLEKNKMDILAEEADLESICWSENVERTNEMSKERMELGEDLKLFSLYLWLEKNAEPRVECF